MNIDWKNFAIFDERSDLPANASMLMEGIPPDQMSEIKFPFLGVLRLKFESEQKVNSMIGYWYDIDNAIYNLARHMGQLQGFDDLREKVEKGAVTFGGRLEFTRLVPPEQS